MYTRTAGETGVCCLQNYHTCDHSIDANELKIKQLATRTKKRLVHDWAAFPVFRPGPSPPIRSNQKDSQKVKFFHQETKVLEIGAPGLLPPPGFT